MRHDFQRAARGACAHPAGRAHVRPHQVRAAPKACAAALTSWPTAPASRRCILIGTGSEVQLCLASSRTAGRAGHSQAGWSACRPGSCSSNSRRNTRMRCCRRQFRRVWRSKPEPASAGANSSGPQGRVIARRDFGASAPLKDLLKHFGFTIENVVESGSRGAWAKAQVCALRSPPTMPASPLNEAGDGGTAAAGA